MLYINHLRSSLHLCEVYLFNDTSFLTFVFRIKTAELYSGCFTKLTYNSVRNKSIPSDSDWLKLLWSDWFENISEKLSG